MAVVPVGRGGVLAKFYVFWSSMFIRRVPTSFAHEPNQKAKAEEKVRQMCCQCAVNAYIQSMTSLTVPQTRPKNTSDSLTLCRAYLP